MARFFNLLCSLFLFVSLVESISALSTPWPILSSDPIKSNVSCGTEEDELFKTIAFVVADNDKLIQFQSDLSAIVYEELPLILDDDNHIFYLKMGKKFSLNELGYSNIFNIDNGETWNLTHKLAEATQKFRHESMQTIIGIGGRLPPIAKELYVWIKESPKSYLYGEYKSTGVYGRRYIYNEASNIAFVSTSAVVYMIEYDHQQKYARLSHMLFGRRPNTVDETWNPFNHSGYICLDESSKTMLIKSNQLCPHKTLQDLRYGFVVYDMMYLIFGDYPKQNVWIIKARVFERTDLVFEYQVKPFKQFFLCKKPDGSYKVMKNKQDTGKLDKSATIKKKPKTKQGDKDDEKGWFGWSSIFVALSILIILLIIFGWLLYRSHTNKKKKYELSTVWTKRNIPADLNISTVIESLENNNSVSSKKSSMKSSNKSSIKSDKSKNSHKKASNKTIKSEKSEHNG